VGANLVPAVRSFAIQHASFAAGDHDVDDGCVAPGSHKLLRFDFVSKNVGNADFVIGRPIDRPDLFEYSAAHGHYHMKQFNQYRLFDLAGNLAVPSKKPGFCLADVEQVLPTAGPAKFPLTCAKDEVMGISAGWADVYEASLGCQYLVIDGVPDGDYTLIASTNTAHAVPEDNFDDNTVCQGLRITGDTVVALATPPIKADQVISALSFIDVAEGETTVRSATFAVRSCGPTHFEITGGPTVLSGPPGTTFGAPLGTTASLPDAHTLSPRSARIWISYTAGKPGETATGTVTIHCTETGQQWTLPITANVIARPTVAAMMVLDISGSMNDDAGDGRRKRDVLIDAAVSFVDILQPGNALGMVTFDQTAHDLMPVTDIGAYVVGGGRVAAKSALSGYAPNPAGTTSIGNGVELGHARLVPATAYDRRAMIVLTDGLENTSKYIADVKSSIDDRVFAIGLGTPEGVSTAALAALASGTKGTLQLTGKLTPSDYFRLSKFYLQILAGLSNSQIVVDPDGWITPGQQHEIAFDLTDADLDCEAILLTPIPNLLDFALRSPDGTRIDPSAASSLGATFVAGNNATFYRLALPVALANAEARAGTWTAIVAVDDHYAARLGRNHEDGVGAHGARYSLSVHAYSNVRLNAALEQTSYEPGATMTIRATLTESGLPLEDGDIRAEVTRPDLSQVSLSLSEGEPGVHTLDFDASSSGLYSVRTLAAGHTLRGQFFTREQVLTGGVWKGGDAPLPSSDTDPQVTRERLCRLLDCLLSERALGRELLTQLARRGADIELIRRCLAAYCERGQPGRRPVEDLTRLLDNPETSALLEQIARAAATRGGNPPSSS
jgi:hypothetical protein